MKYTIHNITHEPFDLDDDIIDFRFEVHYTEPEEMRMKYYYSLSELLKYLEQKHPEFYQYYKSTRDGLDIWGPGERRTLEVIGDEFIRQLYDYLEEHLQESSRLKEMFYHEKKMRSRPVQEQQKTHEEVNKKFKDFFAEAPAFRQSQNRYRTFCEKAEKKLREVALEVYPEIAQMEAGQLKKFKHLFVREIQSMEERIGRLLRNEEKE